MAFTFEKLIVYQEGISYADCICAITEKSPVATASFRSTPSRARFHCRLRSDLEEISKMLSGLINRLDN